MKKIPIILGPTSSGKTTLAIELCKIIKESQIISADSRQVYKYMDIGTGKMPVNSDYIIQKLDNRWVFDGVEVWGYDITTPDKIFSGYDFVKFALEKTREVITQKTTFIVGGTGFYIDLYTKNIIPSGVIPDYEFRKSLENENTDNLAEKLMSLNIDVYNKTDIKNKVRLIRAIERETLIKKRTTSLPYLKDARFIYFGLSASRDRLYKNSDNWLEFVWHNGLIDEVKNLVDKGYKNSPKIKGLVYKSVMDFLQGRMPQEDAVQRAKYDLHAYIRRQQTYFKRNNEIIWFDIEKNTIKEIAGKITSRYL